MKKKWIIGSVVGALVLGLGGTYGVSAVTGNDNWKESEVKITQKEAEEAAGQEVDGLSIGKVEKDEEDGVFLYEIEGQSDKEKTVEIDVDANTGEILKVERGNDDSDNQSVEDMKVSEEDAEKAAKEKASGEVTEMEIDDGHYDFEFKDGAIEYEVTVDGQTGEVIEFEKEKE